MTDYERGFSEGFAAALERMETGPHGSGYKEGCRNKLAVSFPDEQFAAITRRAKERRISLGAAVREMIGLYA